MKHTIILGVAVAGLLMVACSGHKKYGTESVEQTVDVALPEVDSVTLSNVYPGKLTAKLQVTVVARVSGQLMSKHFESGQNVKKGEVLFTIESQTYRDAVAQAEASLATAMSSRDYAQNHYDAVKKALESDAVSKMEVSQAESALNQALASIKSAQAALETAKTNLNYCTVVAPISGTITTSSVDVGNYVNGAGSAVPLTTIYDTSSLTANFAVDNNGGAMPTEESLNLTHIPLIFTDTVTHDYYGDLSYVAPALDSSTGTLALQCVIPNTYGELRPGMFVKVDLPYKTVRDALLVKDVAISTDQLGKYLYVVNDSDKVVYTPVEVGPVYRDSLRLITSGISPDSRYVTKALLKVRDGMKVEPHITK